MDHEMNHEVLGLREIGRDRARRDDTPIAMVGGKGAHLGALSHIEGIDVPAGFCITTNAFRRIIAVARAGDARFDDHLDRLTRLDPIDQETVRASSAVLRDIIEAAAIPPDLTRPIARAIEQARARSDATMAWAVRSSATAEDLPTASFAGQQDTYLNVIGTADVLRHISKCWASLFSERAVTYRLRNGIDHRQVYMAVVVQQMVFPHAAGMLFTADPVSGNRRISVVEAALGLGEALVAGLTNADRYEVRGGAIITKTIAAKTLSVQASSAGGTTSRAVEGVRQHDPALTDAQVIRLVELGGRIAAHFGSPQDIEWCLVDDGFAIVQSRPITTLFPIPETHDGTNHVYLSVGHQQMMTDPMKPLGISFWQLTTPKPMSVVGGRLFVDVTETLASPVQRAGLLDMIGKSDPLLPELLQEIIDRGDFLPPDSSAATWPMGDIAPAGAPAGAPTPVEDDPAIVTTLIARNRDSVATLQQEIQGKTGLALIEFILTDIQELRRLLFHPESHRVIMAAMNATWWLDEHLQAWLGDKRAVDALTLSVANNITSEMGLALLDVADVIRPYPGVVRLLGQALEQADAHFLDALPAVDGGTQAREAIEGWLHTYGMRGVGEIDITRPRWSERPLMLLPLLLGNIRNFEPGASARRFAEGLDVARETERDVLTRLRDLPDGEQKVAETRRMIDRVRTLIGYREYPKYGMVSRYFIYKQALLGEAERLVRDGVLREREDIYYLTLQELQDVVRTHVVDAGLITERRDAFRGYQALTPPRVLTSDGECINGKYRRADIPAGALVGLPVSAGTVEGRARVVLDIATATIEPGDILVTAYTDPSWTPLFVAARGLVTEVGGLMTHGAVIAREYGLPAVVGVEGATKRIRDGQRIRLHGTEGYIEFLS